MAGFNPFGSIPVPPKGSTIFDESHEVSGNFPLSYLCPVFMTETIPGDRWKINTYNLTKLETLIAPAMQQVNASILWMKVPKRLLFKKFKDWYSGGVDGTDDSQKPHIYLRHFIYEVCRQISDDDLTNDWLSQYMGPGSLWQYLGLPCPIKYDSVTGSWVMLTIDEILERNPITHNYIEPPKNDEDYIDIMPFMAYWMLHDQYFRDQTLCTPMFVDSESGDLTLSYTDQDFQLPIGDTNIDVTSSGNDLSEGGEVVFDDMMILMTMYRRAWRKEYFTSALPTPQRGPEVTLNYFGDAKPPVEFEPGTIGSEDIEGGTYDVIAGADTDGDLAIKQPAPDDPEKIIFNKFPNASVDLSGLSPITITAFRNLFKLQAFLEKNNVAGGRFIETILAHWGERVPDFTVQRAQFIRATSVPVQISEVLATANSAGVNGIVGDQAGRARTQGSLGKVSIYTHEPSFIFGLYNVTAPPVYAGQGIPKLYQRITRFDEPWRDFQNIGEQAIKVRELYYPYKSSEALHANDDFGYQQRYSEYKYMPSRVVGDFVTSLSYWHMARMFNQLPYLNAAFVTQYLDERIFAVKNNRPVVADFYFDASARRKLSKFSTPKLT